MFERLVTVRLGRFTERSGVLPATQICLSERSGYLWCIFLVHVPYIAKCIGEWARARIVQIDFRSACGRVNHQEILYKHCFVGIGGSVLSISTQFYLIDHNTLQWTVVGVNWLALCQECRRVVFWGRYCSYYTHRSFCLFWWISWSVMPTPLRWLFWDSKALVLQ